MACTEPCTPVRMDDLKCHIITIFIIINSDNSSRSDIVINILLIIIITVSFGQSLALIKLNLILIKYGKDFILFKDAHLLCIVPI